MRARVPAADLDAWEGGGGDAWGVHQGRQQREQHGHSSRIIIIIAAAAAAAAPMYGDTTPAAFLASRTICSNRQLGRRRKWLRYPLYLQIQGGQTGGGQPEMEAGWGLV